MLKKLSYCKSASTHCTTSIHACKCENLLKERGHNEVNLTFFHVDFELFRIVVCFLKMNSTQLTNLNKGSFKQNKLKSK